ncbi:MAG: alkaline shock response membrane anchor protein AmaP [Candidatus Omnitrophota bacterium]
MRAISTLTIILYSLLFIVFGAALVAVSFNLLSRETIVTAVDYLFISQNVRLIVGASGGIIILIALFILQVIIGRFQSEKTIAFENPDGRVTLSLSAIEDFIKRLVRQIPDVKEFKPTVVASKRGVDITNRVVLYTDTNIPEVTERIQNVLKSRIQDMLGIEESVSIRVHVAKIVQREAKKEAKPAEEDSAQVPYRGIEY